MARYEYSCQDCKHAFTISERMSEHAEGRKGKKPKGPECPECGSRDTRQVFSPFFAKTSSKT